MIEGDHVAHARKAVEWVPGHHGRAERWTEVRPVELSMAMRVLMWVLRRFERGARSALLLTQPSPPEGREQVLRQPGLTSPANRPSMAKSLARGSTSIG